MQLTIERCRSKVPIDAVIAAYHSTHRPPQGWKVAFLLVAPGPAWEDLGTRRILGASTFGRPVAKAEDQSGATLEHTRMALAPTAPKNSASWFMGATRKWIRANMPEVRRLIAYVDETDHTGVTYRADNWATVYRARRERGRWSSRPGRTARRAVLRTKFERAP